MPGQGCVAFDNTTGYDSGVPTCGPGAFGIDNNVYFEWFVPEDGDYVVTTCGLTSVDTKIVIYALAECGLSPVPLACNDDFCGLQSRVVLDRLQQGEYCVLRLGSYPGTPGGTGQICIEKFEEGSNDPCSAVPIVGTGCFPFDNTYATTSVGQPVSCSLITNDVWFEWTATTTGTHWIETCGQASIDTVLAVYGFPPCQLSVPEVGCDDDGCSGTLQSRVVIDVATAPTTYWIRLGSYNNGPRGSGQLCIWPPYTAPLAQFVGSPTSGVAPLNVAFTNQSAGTITSRLWNFGDGTTSSATNPAHLYTSPGTYTVSLTVSGPGGSDVRTRTNYITVSHPAPTAD
ncbi:MAG: PKD domain-containing protein, partial [bacterium]|nr:PKD domain-containing protein [bacterium]